MSTWDQSKFNIVLAEYLETTSRSATAAINTKAYYIARGAARLTVKVAKEQIEAELGKIINVQKISRKGTTYNRKALQLTQGRDSLAPLAGLIINARRGKNGDPGLQGRDMRTAIKRLIGTRKRSIAFIASGWIPAIKTLARYADKIGGAGPDLDSSVKQFGSAKGRATPAKKGDKVIFATIQNSASARNDRKNALALYGARGLQLAFDAEASSMIEYLDKKLKPGTAAANRRL